MEPEPTVKTLMVALYYPASLGAGLVWFLTKVAKDNPHFWNIENGFALFLLASFSVSFVVLLHAPKYDITAFALDICETVLIFLLFFFLGMVDKDQAERLDRFYQVFLYIPFLEATWNIVLGYPQKNLLRIGAVAAAISALGWLWLWKYPWFNRIALAVFFVLLFIYAARRGQPPEAESTAQK